MTMPYTLSASALNFLRNGCFEAKSLAAIKRLGKAIICDNGCFEAKGLAKIKRLRKAIIYDNGCFSFFSKKFAGNLAKNRENSSATIHEWHVKLDGGGSLET